MRVCNHGRRDPHPNDLECAVKLFSHRKHAGHLGPYPLERLARTRGSSQTRPGPIVRHSEARTTGPWAATAAFQPYLDLCDSARVGDVAPAAPLPDDAWTGERYEHHRCVLVLIPHTRELKSAAPGDEWIDGT